ncbi:MAG: hypothetical protein H6843_17540 [Rhodospirillaceae bacterium]|nr:hypothetical protein [Rhodospirillaceae bacterium]
MPADPSPKSSVRDLAKVQALLRSKTLPGDYIFQLVDYERRLRTGFLATEDRNFIDALYQWYLTTPESGGTDDLTAAEPQAVPAGGTDRLLKTDDRLRAAEARIAELEREIRDLTDGYEQQIAILRRNLATADSGRAKGGHEDDHRFQEVRRLFARQFHPDNIDATGQERDIRTNIFKSFWSEISRIERS